MILYLREEISSRNSSRPGLAAVLVRDCKDNETDVRMKKNAFNDVGIIFYNGSQ